MVKENLKDLNKNNKYYIVAKEKIYNAEIVEVTGDIKIPFTAIHDKFGRAEFSLCPIWKHGKLVELWIYPLQQDNHGKICWHWVGSAYDMTINGYEGLADPKIWMATWCKYHKTTCIRLYVPNGAKYLWIHPLSSLTIGFTQTDF